MSSSALSPVTPHMMEEKRVDLLASGFCLSNVRQAVLNPETVAFLETQKKAVLSLMRQQGILHEDRQLSEVNWFYGHLGMDWFYFQSETPEQITEHITALYASRMLSKISGTPIDLKLQTESSGKAMFVAPSFSDHRGNDTVNALEERIETIYRNEGFTTSPDTLVKIREGKHPYRVQCYRTSGTIDESSNIHLRLYFAQIATFSDEPLSPTETDVRKLGDPAFLKASSEGTKTLFSEIMSAATKSGHLGPDIRFKYYDDSLEARLLICYKWGSVHSFWTGLSELYRSYGLYSTRKYIEQFKNGYAIHSVYLRKIGAKTDEESLEYIKSIEAMIIKDTNLMYVLPRSSLTPMFTKGELTNTEITYAYCGWKFAYQFVNAISTETNALFKSMKEVSETAPGAGSASASLMQNLKRRLKTETFTEARVRETIMCFPDLVKLLYLDFVYFHEGEGPVDAMKAKERLDTESTRYKQIVHAIKKRVVNSEFSPELDEQIFTAFLVFNRHVQKTNFFRLRKVALCFRLDARFICNSTDYPVTPFALFFMVGAEFRGFHLRFSDVARGGVRIITSRSAAAFSHNVSTLFDEVYALASTQQRKNKDIPEGGSKGGILLALDHQDKARVAFQKYVDALLDVILPRYVYRDYYAKEEIVFLGPDEGTADLMNWASDHARLMGAAFWSAFTTGKSRSRGGIPHDLFGMTTRSIHQYVLGILAKKGVDESSITKAQTGGPDGDLGSNEVKISRDRTITVVDGSGVAYDPEGLDRTELLRLAESRLMVRDFDRKKLSAQGFFVDVDSSDITLPSGRFVESGLTLRNTFHLDALCAATLFVPCGGRPESINIANVDKLLDAKGVPKFKYIVEGANLFFTQEARLFLEKAGVVIYKDASANKGGVTSSSMEVLAALALSDDEFAEHMAVRDDENPPAFYTNYVKCVHDKIENNARGEFECIWNENERTGKPRSVLTDLLSIKINDLHNAVVQQSSLWDNHKLREVVFQQACPQTLIDLIGVDTIIRRIPEAYAKAIFGSHIASRFVYEFGLNPPEFAFFEFVRNLTQQE